MLTQDLSPRRRLCKQSPPLHIELSRRCQDSALADGRLERPRESQRRGAAALRVEIANVHGNTSGRSCSGNPEPQRHLGRRTRRNSSWNEAATTGVERVDIGRVVYVEGEARVAAVDFLPTTLPPMTYWLLLPQAVIGTAGCCWSACGQNPDAEKMVTLSCRPSATSCCRRAQRASSTSATISLLLCDGVAVVIPYAAAVREEGLAHGLQGGGGH